MRASRTLSIQAKQRPTAQLCQGKRAAPTAKPIPNRAMKAAVVAALLSGKLIGNMIAMSITPNTRPHTLPTRTLDMGFPFRPLLTRALLSKASSSFTV
jgi:hypothetical protein